MIRAICLTSGVRLLVEIDKMTAKLASVWKTENCEMANFASQVSGFGCQETAFRAET